MTDKNNVDDDNSLNDTSYLDYSNYCDESKCVSSLFVSRKQGGGSYNNENNNNNNDKVPTFMCYAEGGKGILPFACAEGYEGFVVENEPPFLYEGENLFYYTCCHSSLVALSYQRHCSNTIVIGNNDEEEGGSNNRGETNLCSDGSNSSVTSEFDDSSPKKKKYLRNMTRTYGHLESYICCDEELLQPNDNNTSLGGINNFFDDDDDDVDCVPYLCIDIFDYNCISKNRYGVLETMTCKDTLYDGIFIYPKVVVATTTNNNNEIRFECCKTGTETHLLPTNTQAFKLTYGIQLVLSSITLVFLLVLTIGLLRPLVMKALLKCKKSEETTTPSASSTTLATTTTRSFRRRRQSQQLRDQQKQQQPYGAYNLYLVYLLLPDLVSNIFMLSRCSKAFTGKTFNATLMVLHWDGISVDDIDYSGADVILWTCMTANLMMNTVIAYEVFKFLKNSFELVRDPVPTLRKVSLQAVGVYVYSILFNFIFFVLLQQYKYIFLYLTVTNFGPFFFSIYICILIWKRGYIKCTTAVEYKHLAIYFLRVVFVFILFWFPITIMGIIFPIPTKIGYGSGTVQFSMHVNESAPPLFAIMMIMMSLQSIATVCLALLKPDVQKMVRDLFTCCYCC